jgi:hypothetical protein
MSGGMVTFKVDESGFSKAILDLAAVSRKSFEEVFADQGRLLAAELMKRTPPFSGKALVRMLDARGAKLRDTEVEDLSALAVGKRRVEKDIRKVVYGLEGAKAGPGMMLSGRHNQVIRASPNATTWGTMQKCEGQQAMRVFATKGGTVYGVDMNHWAPDAGISDLAAHVQGARGKRGRVTMAGQKTRNIGRWRWLNVLVTKEEMVKEFVKLKQWMVGEARGGWGAFFTACGGKLGSSGWVGKHAKRAGTCKASFERGNVSITAVNHSRWASGGDPDRIIEKAMAGRAEAIAGSMEHELDRVWRKH